MTDFFDAALDRLAKDGLTVAKAMRMTDADLLRCRYVGRKTLRVVRSFAGPHLPQPTRLHDEPMPEDFKDAHGYIDWEDFDYAWDQWRQKIDFERDQLPDLRECWCGEPQPEPEGLSLADILQSLMEA